MRKKYELIDDQVTMINIDGKDHALRRIHILDPNIIEKYHVYGELGGWLESEKNLSQEGSCMVLDKARVFGTARIDDDALIMNTAFVYGYARVHGNARIKDRAIVKGAATIDKHAIIENSATISGNVHIYGHANVFGNAAVSGSVDIYNNASIGDHAVIDSKGSIFENAKIRGHAKILEDITISGSAVIYDQATISGSAVVKGNAAIYENAVVTGTSTIDQYVHIGEDAEINTTHDIFYVGPIGSRNDFTTFYTTNSDIYVSCGCFNDSIKNFRKKVQETHPDDCHGQAYLAAADIAHIMLDSRISSPKYIITDNQKEITTPNGEVVTVYQIKTKQDIFTPGTNLLLIKENELGGWVESEKNLAQDGSCIILDYACAYGNAVIKNDALVRHTAQIYGDAVIQDTANVQGNAMIGGHACVKGDSIITSGSKVLDSAIVEGDSCVHGAIIQGNAHISGNAEVYSNALVSGSAIIADNATIGVHSKIFGNAEISGDTKIKDWSTICGKVILNTSSTFPNHALITVTHDYYIPVLDATTINAMSCIFCKNDVGEIVVQIDHKMYTLQEVVSGNMDTSIIRNESLWRSVIEEAKEWLK